MAKYYAYNPDGEKPKYVEISEQQYLAAKYDKQRWFISFGSSVLECSEEEFGSYCQEINHHRYIMHNRNGKLANVLSLDELDTDHLGFMDSGERIDKTVLDQILRELLHQAIASLHDNERDLIEAIFFQNMSKKEFADSRGISLRTFYRRKAFAIQCLRDYIERFGKYH